MSMNPQTHVSASANIPKDVYKKLQLQAKDNFRSVSAEICFIITKNIEAKEVSK